MMPWFVPHWSESIKKRLCRYLLQRYLGQFLEEKLTLDQLTIDLYNGKGIVSNVSLDAQALNELAEQQSMPVWFVQGSVASVSVSIPWLSLLSDSSYVEVSGLHVIVQPKQRSENCASMLESMWNSLSSSMQLAEECLKQEAPDIDAGAPLEGLELFAQTIDSILSRVKVRFIDTTLRLEHIPEGSSIGVGLEMRIEQMTYLDEAGMDEPDPESESGKYQVSAFTTKKISLEGVKMYTDEFNPSIHTMERQDASDHREHAHIWAAQLAGRQEVRLQMKQSETIQGPKVSLEVLLGSLTIFLSPRQLHGLLALVGGLASPCGHNDNVTGTHGRQKPMEARDFHLVEQDLQRRLMPPDLRSPQRLYPNQGWSTTAGESDEEEFVPLKGSRTAMASSGAGMTSSVASSIGGDSLSSSMTASTMTSVSSFTHKCLTAGMPTSEGSSTKKRSVRRSTQEEAWSADTTTFLVRASSLAIVLLQEDVLVVEPSPSCHVTSASTLQMATVAAEVFACLGELASVGFGVKDFDRARDVFRNASRRSHIRLLAAPVTIEGTERTGSAGAATEGNVTAARLEVLEVLPEQLAQDSELLRFEGPLPGAPFAITPDFQLSFSRCERQARSKQPVSSIPRTRFSFRLQPCLVEVDISLMDRVVPLLTSPQWASPNNPHSSGSTTGHRDMWREAVDSSASSESIINLALHCPLLTIKLRFPCPDLRPLSDMMRTPYWIRSVRPDWLLMDLRGAVINSTIDSRDPALRVELSGRELNLFFQEIDQESRVELLTAQADEPGQSLPGGGEGFGLLRAVLTVNPTAPLGELIDLIGCDMDDSEDNGNSLATLERQARSREPSPFSAKRVVHESDTPHATPAGEPSDGAADELLIPGDKREMSEFIELASRGSRVHLDLCLPNGRLTVPSKHLYELVYNRLTTDLLLWESAHPSESATNTPLLNLQIGDLSLGTSAFAMCKSSLNLDTDSDSSSESEGVFYSIHELRQRQKRQRVASVSRNSGQSLFTLALNVGHCVISLSTPLRDSSGSVIPNQRGELRLQLVESSLFCVSNHRGDPSLSYVCVQANQAALQHLGLVPADIEETSLLPTIVQTSAGASVRTGGEPVGTGAHCSLDMLTVAVRIHLDEAAALKMIRVAAGVRGATLLHRVTPGPQSWLSQMIDMLDVLDFPVHGYTPPRVLTELHLHLWDCAVDYRPLHLPVRALVTLGSFSVSSNLAAATRSSSLRFIAEEGAFFLSTHVNRPGPADLRHNYVCVLELGLFELALRLSEDSRPPKVDLRASSTALHVRTCADSCRALADLLIYFASDGDLGETRPSTPAPSNAKHVQGSQQGGNIASHAELVPNMMEEAMRDAGNGLHATGDDKTMHFRKLEEGKDEDEAFCFPGDSGTQASATVTKSSDDDEEFCILGEDPGTGIVPASGEPEVRRLVNGPVRVVENHFAVPLGRSDPLQAPRHFPAPVLRYTLCDLALVWHIYGGSDFETSRKRVHMEDELPSRETIMQGVQQPSVSFSKNNPYEVRFAGSAQNSPARRSTPQHHQTLSWQARGGPGRDHDTLMELHLSKVRFRHEVYPENAAEASRQVLLVQSVEIRDRLASSAINKFLYLHCTEAQPRQAHANMVVVKAVHLRPDTSLPSQQECCLRVSILPLRLNIDQDALLFLCNFFVELGASTDPAVDEEGTRGTSVQPPVMSVQGIAPPSPATSDTSEQLLPTLRPEDDTRASPPLFFRTLMFSPDVPVRVDYQGKRVDMTHGPLAGLMGLAQLNCSELRLKRLVYRHGLLGVDKLVSYMLSEWLTDIKKNQLPSVLGGVGPMHSFVQLFQGVRDLVLLPIEQYQRDGRLVRGLQRGAHSFTSSTAMAALELTNRLVHAVQVTAETAYDMLSPGPSVRQRRLLGSTSNSRRRRQRYLQPADIREGVANAYHLVQEGLGETARNLVAVASAEHEEKGVYGAVGGVLRQIPPTVVTPILLGAEAASSVLGGVRSQLAPDVRREAAQKWRSEPSN